MSVAYVLRMFGALRLEVGSESLTKFPTRRSALILARLAMTKEGGIGRDELAEQLWPDDFLDVTRLRLRQELRRLRQVVGKFGDHVRADRQWVEIEPGILTTDVEMFDSAVASGLAASDPSVRISSLSKAVEQISGPFLAGYQEPWVVAIRREYEEKSRRVWLELADAFQASGELDDALRATSMAVRNSPLDIDANSALIRRLAERGNAALARQAFLDFDSILFRELGSHAPQSLRNIAREPAGEPEQSPAAADERPRSQVLRPLPLFGRAEALQSIAAALSRPGTSIVLVGPVGVGKTHLLKESAWQFFHDSQLTVRFGGIPESVADGLFLPDPCDDEIQLLESIRQASERGWRVLAESRVRLDADGITEILIGPLPAPHPADGPEAILSNPSVRILTSRIAEHGGVAAGDQNSAKLRDLAVLLDGMPSALKVFGSRLVVQTPDKVLQTLDEGLAEYSADISGALQRVVTELPKHVQVVLFGLALLDGASADLADKLAAPHDAAEVWRSLEKRCLITVQDDGHRRRYRIPNPLAFVIRTEAVSENYASLEKETWKKLSEWAYDKSRLMSGPDQGNAFTAVQAELPNLFRGLAWAISLEPGLAAHLVVGTWRTVCARGNPSVEAGLLLEAVRAGADLLPPKLAGEAWVGTAAALSIGGRLLEAEEAYIGALKIYGSVGDVNGIAWATMNYATTVVRPRDPRLATDLCKQAADQTSDKGVKTIALCFYAFGLADMGEISEAVRVGEEVFAIRLQSQDLTEQARAYGDLADLYRRVGRPEAARPLLEEGVQKLRKAGIQDRLFGALMSLIAINSNEDEVRELLVEAQGLANRIGSSSMLLEVARAKMSSASKQGDMYATLAAIEDMFRFSQLTQSPIDRERSLRSLADELERQNRFEYANAVRTSLGDAVEGPMHAGWKTLLSSDSHATVCVLAVVMAKEALQPSA